MASGRETRPRYDERYKHLFAFPRMVEDLLRFVSGDQLATSDFSTLRKLSAEYVSDELLKRHGDTVWRLWVGDGWAFGCGVRSRGSCRPVRSCRRWRTWRRYG